MKKRLREIIKSLIPQFIYRGLDAESFSIAEFMKFAAREVGEGQNLLDAGAGACPYKDYFSHTKYESTDFEHIFDQDSKKLHNFICNLNKIPKHDNTYDVIISTQVLEHVENPQKVIDEFYRILKPGGKLFLTAPQGWGIHGAPYHFFNFTNFGLEFLFKQSGFTINFIKSRGGIFWYLGHRIKIFPKYVFDQYRDCLIGFLFFPIYVLFQIFCAYLMPPLFFYLDRLDKKMYYTLGYKCYCVKTGKV